MYGLIAIGTIIGAYVATFKDDFEKENIEKVLPFIIVACLLLIVLGILGSVVSK